MIFLFLEHCSYYMHVHTWQTAYRVDACKNLVASSPVNCGAPAANEFCQRKDLVRLHMPRVTTSS